MCFSNQAKRMKTELNNNKTLISDTLILEKIIAKYKNTVDYLWDAFGL